jgi:hypothetical protein
MARAVPRATGLAASMILFLAAGCGRAGSGAVAEAGDGAAIGEAGPPEHAADGGRVDAATVGAMASCPATPPRPASPCASGAACSWGDHPLPECRTHAVCTTTLNWTAISPPTYCGGLEPGCPAAAPATFPATCPSTTLTCVYGGATRCSCTPCLGPSFGAPNPQACPMNQPVGTPVWFCVAPPALAPPCPAVVPNDGTPCDVPAGVSCPPAHCGDPFTVVCRNGRWRWTTDTTAPCPG